MRVLVTGGGGYLGGHLVQRLTDQRHDIVVVDRFLFEPKRGAFERGFPGVDAKLQDYRTLTVDDLKKWKIEVIYHLAAFGSDPAGAINVPETYDNNTLGTAELARRAKLAGVPQFVFTSSCSVYGLGQGMGLKPGAVCNPVSEYGASKMAAEVLLNYEALGLRIARLGTLGGPGHPVTRTRFDLAINAMTRSAIENGEIKVYGGGAQWRPMIDVRNAAYALASLPDEPEGTYNVSAYNVQTVRLASQIADSLSLAEDREFPTIEIVQDAPDRRDYHVEPSKLKYTNTNPPVLYSAGESARDVEQGLRTGDVRVEPDTCEVWERELKAKTAKNDPARLAG